MSVYVIFIITWGFATDYSFQYILVDQATTVKILWNIKVLHLLTITMTS